MALCHLHMKPYSLSCLGQSQRAGPLLAVGSLGFPGSGCYHPGLCPYPASHRLPCPWQSFSGSLLTHRENRRSKQEADRDAPGTSEQQSPRALETRLAPSPRHCLVAQRHGGRVPEVGQGRAVPGRRQQVTRPTQPFLSGTVVSVAQAGQAALGKLSNRRPLTTTCAPGSARGLGLMSGDTM